MSTAFCPCCRRPMPPETREGVRLTPLKARIFDCVRRAGIDGISSDDINTIVFDGRSSPANVRNHIHQINDTLIEVDLRIDGNEPRGFYRIRPVVWPLR